MNASINSVNWIHPSYRDLVIEELASNTRMRQHFLKNMSLEGVKLVFSRAGGAHGTRDLPLLQEPADLELAQQRCAKIATSNGRIALQILNVICDCFNQDKTQPPFRSSPFLEKMCDSVRETWNQSRYAFTSDELRTFARLTIGLDHLVPLPSLDVAWKHTVERIRSAAEVSDWEEFVSMVTVIENSEPRFLQKIQFRGAFAETITRLVHFLEDRLEDLEAVAHEPNADADDVFRAVEEINDILSLKKWVFRWASTEHVVLAKLFDDFDTTLRDLEDRPAQSPDDPTEPASRPMDDSISIPELFADL